MIHALLIAAAVAAQPAQPQEDAILATVQALFDGIAQRDKAAMTATVLPGAVATHVADGKVQQFQMAKFIADFPAGTQKIEERMYDPLVRIHGDVAMVWAPFDFLVDGKINHCGTDIFDMVRLNGQWKIATVTWNDIKDCPAR